jgi:hypothetical protein
LKNTFLFFVDYEKAFEGVGRLLLLNISQARNNPNPLLTAITNMYENNIKIILDNLNTTNKN